MQLILGTVLVVAALLVAVVPVLVLAVREPGWGRGVGAARPSAGDALQPVAAAGPRRG